MKIAIIGSFDFHLGCIGFILEIFKNSTIDIYLKKGSDKYNHLEYYSTLYNFKANIIDSNNFPKYIIEEYDKIFKLTSCDNCLHHKKIISILHAKGWQYKCISEKMLSLTPYIQGNNIYYTFPIYNPILKNFENNKIVTLIGYYENKSFDEDTISFINNNKNYKFNFVIWGSSSYPNLNNLNNVTIYHNIKTTHMGNLINDSKYILSKKFINYDIYSGQLDLAMSYEKPLIIDIKTKNNYNLPGIPFIREYSELGKLDDITDDKYTALKREITIIKNKMLNNNMLLLTI